MQAKHAQPAPQSAYPEHPSQPPDDQIEVFGLTHPGLVRRQNQDHFLLCSLHKTMRVVETSLPNPELLEIPSERLAFLGMVADGVGGTDGGEEASRIAVAAVTQFVTRTMQCYYSSNPLEIKGFVEALRVAAWDCHDSVLERARVRPELAGLATTLTMAISVWPALFILQVGDSRAYRLRDGQLELLTRDQTLAQALVDDGVLTASRAHRSPFAHVLSSAIGGRHADPVVIHHESRVDDVMLLCTDGLTKHVSDLEIRDRLVAMASPEQACRALVDDGLAAGGSDNITVVVGRSSPSFVARQRASAS